MTKLLVFRQRQSIMIPRSLRSSQNTLANNRSFHTRTTNEDQDMSSVTNKDPAVASVEHYTPTQEQRSMVGSVPSAADAVEHFAKHTAVTDRSGLYRSAYYSELDRYTEKTSRWHAFTRLTPSHPVPIDTCLYVTSMSHLDDSARSETPTALTSEKSTMLPTDRSITSVHSTLRTLDPQELAAGSNNDQANRKTPAQTIDCVQNSKERDTETVSSEQNDSETNVQRSGKESNVRTTKRDLTRVILEFKLMDMRGHTLMKSIQNGVTLGARKEYAERRLQMKERLPKTLDCEFSFAAAEDVGTERDCSPVLIGPLIEISSEQLNHESGESRCPPDTNTTSNRECSNDTSTRATNEISESHMRVLSLTSQHRGLISNPYTMGSGDHVNSMMLKCIFLQTAHLVSGKAHYAPSSTHAHRSAQLDMVASNIKFTHYVEFSSVLDVRVSNVRLVPRTELLPFEATEAGKPCVEWCTPPDSATPTVDNILYMDFAAYQAEKLCCRASLYFAPVQYLEPIP